ncbi:MAG: phytanoyl-CoA dioxygenase [Gammaproteobacteria bacterium]|nr:phytanoyl-CoA dioxygenase [Gammaproteobacteria bacterium]
MLSDQQLNAFKSQGYLVVNDVFDQTQIIRPLINEYEEKLATLCVQWKADGSLPNGSNSWHSFDDCIKAVYDAGLDYFQPLDISLPPEQITAETPMHAGDAVFNLMTAASLLDLIESIIGPEITSNPIQHVRIKPPAKQLYQDESRAHITSTDWHQDRAVTLEEADHTRMITAWIAMTDATVENGCLQVIPGSHRNPMLHHCPNPQLAIPQSQFDVTEAQPLPVRSGGVILFDPLTVHSSLTNQTNHVRWSFDLRYNVTGDPTGRPMFPSFVARSGRNPTTELRDPAIWRSLWKNTQHKLISEPPVTIHRWPHDPLLCA